MKALVPSRVTPLVSKRAQVVKHRQTRIVYAAAAGMGSSGGGEESYEVVVFPRLKERDVWRRLGVSKDASYEEIQDARNYLVETHRTHAEGVEAIEDAFDKIISQKLKQRKKEGKINLKQKKEDVTEGWKYKIMTNIENPKQKLVLQRLAVYAFLAVWSLYQSAATGPAFQVAVSFILTIYLLCVKRGGKGAILNSLKDSFLALLAGWLVGTVLPVYLSFLFPPALSPETICALFSFITMWWTATFWK